MVEKLIKQCDRAFSSTERTNQESQWVDLVKYILTSQSGLFQGNNTPGDKKTVGIYEPTAIQSNLDLSAAIHSTLTNPATKWSNIRYVDDQFNNRPETVAWINNASKTIHRYINDSNFDTQASKNYQSLCALGNQILFQEEINTPSGQFQKFRFEAIHLSEVAWSENKYGEVDVVYRKFKLTNRQLEERWPDNLPDYIYNEIDEFPEREQDIIFVVTPRDRYSKAKFASDKDRPYKACYILRKGQHLLEETGYYEFPYFVTRWNTRPGEVYGTGPGHIALPEIKTINEARKYALEAIPLAILPPQKVNERDLLSDVNMTPLGLTVMSDINGIQRLDIGGNPDYTQFILEESRNLIKSIFFLDKLFLPPRTETGEMTAFEIDQRLAQMQRVLGPTLSRLNNEFLAPLIVRCFKILLRAGKLGELPEELKKNGVDIEINFVNQLSRAQQIEELMAIRSWIQQDIMLAAQIKPEVIDYFNADWYVKQSAKIAGLSEELVTNDDEVAQNRQQRQQQQAQEQAIQQGVNMADISAKMQKGGTNV